MRYRIACAILVGVVTAAACKNKSTEPTSSTTTTTVATTSVSTTTVSTTSVNPTFTVRGRVTSEKDGSILQFADIEIISGANVGRRFQGDNAGNYSMSGLSAGVFVARYWAQGYLVKDVQIVLTTSDQTVDVQLTPVPPSTTTTIALQANFTFSPNPCTFSPGPSINCTVDSGSSTGDITSRKWNYGGKEVVDQVIHSLSFVCGDLVGSGTVRTLSVRLTVFDAAGNLSTVDNGVPVSIVGGACP